MESFCPGGSNPNPNVIWCDDFEDNSSLSSKYFEFDSDGGDFSRITYERFQGQYALRARFQQGEIDAGHFMYNFGRNPIGTQSHSNQDFQEIYWRIYVKLQNGFVGFPSKLTRATIFAGTAWQQAMIAHVWASSTPGVLLMDPATGIDQNGNLVTTGWNDFANLRWLGYTQGKSILQPGNWYCVEAHVKLNNPGSTNGVFEFWIDNNLDARRTDLNWVNTWTGYGINSVFFSNYWNQGSPTEQERYLDALVVSTSRIGCIDNTVPAPPTNLKIIN